MVSTKVLDKTKSVNRFAEKEYLLQPGFETTLVRQNLSFLEPMIFSLLTRGWITDRDKEFLDLLAPSHCISFIIYDGKYLNPEGLELFPHELIENALAQKSPAVFSHIFRPENNNISQNYKIETAMVNFESEKPIVFGFFGPEEILAKENHCHDFHTIISRFREAHDTAEKMIVRIECSCEPDSNLVAVNRTSGRIIYISENMLSDMNKEDREIIGIEYNQFKKMLQTPFSSGKLKLQNLNINDFMVTTMAISPTPQSEQLRTKTESFIKTELEKTIEKTKRRFEIYDHLFISLPEKEKKVLRETSAKLISNLTIQYNQLSSMIKSNAPAKRVNLLYEFDQAVENCSKSLGLLIEPIIERRVNDLYTKADPKIIRTLFESILISHYHDYPVIKSSINFNNTNEMEFTMTTEIDKTVPEIKMTEQLQISENISTISGYDLKIITKNKQIITRLTFNKIER